MTEGFLASLGIYTNFASASLKGVTDNPLIERFYLQSLGRKIAPKSHRLRVCLRHLAPFKDAVEVRRYDDAKNAAYGNLVVCASVWACPVCAARITEQRRAELGAALDVWQRRRKGVVMVTYTLAHNRQMRLRDVLAVLKKARQRFKAGRRWQSIKSEYQIVGTIGATEVTWGVNGWHPHVHELIFFDCQIFPQQLIALQIMLQEIWVKVLQKEGGSAIRDIGLQMTLSNAKIADYVTKFGREHQSSAWDLEHEMTKNPTKKGRDEDHATPTELLIAYGNGSQLAGQLWRDYVEVFHGRQQLVWSVGLKALLGLKDKTDEQIAESEGVPYSVLATISSDTWRALLQAEKNGLVRSRLLLAAKDGAAAVDRFIADTLYGQEVG